MQQLACKIERHGPGEPGGLHKVHVGCGPHHIRQDWWNTDLRAFPGVDEAMDASAPWRWQGLLDFVYAEHFLEHLDLDQGLSFLVEAGRALKESGRIRLTTPSLEWVMKTHFAFGEPEDVMIRDTMRINRAFHGWGHRFLYSASMLRKVLEEVGYKDVEFFDYGRSRVADLANLEMHGDHSIDFGYPSVLIVEARKADTVIENSAGFQEIVEQSFSQYTRAGH